MKKHNYKIAGLEFLISTPSELMYEKEYRLRQFAVDTVFEPHELCFLKAEELSLPDGICVHRDPNRQIYQNGDFRIQYIGSDEDRWKNAYFRAEHHGKKHTVELRAEKYPKQVDARTVLEAMELPHLILEVQGVLLHSSFVEYQGKAILFTAPSQTGKSTQAELWKTHRGADVVNGDRAIVRVSGENVTAEGVPFSGSSPYCKNRSLPLEAIVYLAQAQVTTIRRLRGFEAFSRIWEGITVDSWDSTDLKRAADVVKLIAERVPVYYMPCTPDDTAIIALEHELGKRIYV